RWSSRRSSGPPPSTRSARSSKQPNADGIISPHDPFGDPRESPGSSCSPRREKHRAPLLLKVSKRRTSIEQLRAAVFRLSLRLLSNVGLIEPEPVPKDANPIVYFADTHWRFVDTGANVFGL